MADYTFDHIFIQRAEALVTEGSAGGVQLKWTAENNINFYATQVWIADFNDISKAALYATCRDNSVWVPLDANVTKFFWIRHVDTSNQINSGYFPPTVAGVQGTSPPTKLSDIEFNDPTSDFDVICANCNITANKFVVASTNTGTIGNVVINNMSGRVNIAASGTSITVTNANVTTASHVFAVASQNDSTGYVKNVVPGSGSFVIHVNAPAAQMSIDFFIVN